METSLQWAAARMNHYWGIVSRATWSKKDTVQPKPETLSTDSDPTENTSYSRDQHWLRDQLDGGIHRMGPGT